MDTSPKKIALYCGKIQERHGQRLEDAGGCKRGRIMRFPDGFRTRVQATEYILVDEKENEEQGAGEDTP